MVAALASFKKSLRATVRSESELMIVVLGVV
jgi:hypothetical protein